MYKFVVLALLVAVAQGGLINIGGAPLAYAGAPLAYAGAPLAYANAAPLAVAAPVAVAAPAAYAIPPPREIAEAPIVQQSVEPVEQHGYSVRY